MAVNQGLQQGVTLRGGIYRIEKILGRGSFGITYLATGRFTTEGNLGRMEVEAKVCVKEFFMSDVNTRKSDGTSVEGSSGSVFTNYRKKFRKEAENLSKLSHPNIVKVLDVFDENNTTYYAMEFIEGTNLDDWIRDCGGMSESEAIPVLCEVGRALSYMHDRRMLHLDIKPKNIMRRADGTDILIDFGLSKQFTEGGEPESSTSIGLGTPGYAPLEQSAYQQDGTFPATLDVYALGATFFKMLTGRRPPEATVILNEGFPEEDLLACGISPSTVSILAKAMAAVRKKRYPDVASFLEDLTERTVIEAAPQPVPEPVPEPEPTPIPEPKPEPKPAPKSKPKSVSKPKSKPEEPKPAPRPEPKPEPAPAPKPKPEQGNKFMAWLKGSYGWAWLLGACAVAAAIVIIATSGPKTTPAEEVPATEVTNDIVDETVTDMDWASPLGQAKYTGVVRDGVPDGKGVARIIAGDLEGSVYDGEFKQGKMDGEATYTLKNGDKFIGTFKNNEYDNGRYISSPSGDYFEGTFKNGQPDQGVWYNKNGKKLQ